MKKRLVALSILVFATTILVLGVLFLTQRPSGDGASDINEITASAEEDEGIDEVAKTEVQSVDFQAVVEDWVSSVGGSKSIMIYDLDKNELVGEYNSEEDYNTASLYKLFVVYEGYRRVESGVWPKDEYLAATGQTILECLDLAIRESDSTCAEALWGMIGHEELDRIIRDDYKITSSDISSLISNPRDILKMMQLFYQHADVTDPTLIERMQDSFLNQPVTTYDWRQGLPSGFSVAKVYNKVGWDYDLDGNHWNLYHDAAIVEFPEADRHFAVVAMTNFISPHQIKRLGTMIEESFLAQTAN